MIQAITDLLSRIFPLRDEEEEDEVLVCAHCYEQVEYKHWHGMDDWETWEICPSCELVEPDTVSIPESEYLRRNG